MELKISNLIHSSNWDDVVQKIYKKPYCLQQQGGCCTRGKTFNISVPSDDELMEIDYDEEIVGNEMEINMDKWMETPANKYDETYFHRQFYPNLYVIAEDLYEKGVLPAGNYTILID